MPVLNFQKQFAPLVKNGTKRQTIRSMRKRPIKVGDTLYLYTGMRTKNCEKLCEKICTNVKNIKIYEKRCMFGDSIYVDLDGCTIHPHERDIIAKDDGFDNFFYMYRWIKKNYGLPFDGQLITW